MVINSLLSHATDTWDEFALAIERLNIPEAVGCLTSSYIIEDLPSLILDFQVKVVRIAYRLKMTAIDHEEPEMQENTTRLDSSQKLRGALIYLYLYV